MKAELQKLCEETDTKAEEWEVLDGPTTGVGAEYWFRHEDGREAYVVNDQGEITYAISTCDS